MTALELINRVMLLRRQPTISAYQETNPEHVATLNVLNMAKEDLLATRRPEFDLRHDGQLATRATLTSRSLTATILAASGATSATLTMGDTVTAGANVYGEYVVRMIPTGDTDYSATSFRVTSSLPTFYQATLNFPFALPKAFADVAVDLVYSEYLLPDTVREVVRASFEQEPLSLQQIDPTSRFDELYPSFTYEQGRPRVFSVGGFDTQTYVTSSTTPDPKLRAIVWPIPDDEYVINYSYYYRHPDFEDGDSELVGVPPEFVNDIVMQAYSVMAQAWDGNTDAAYLGEEAQRSASIKGNLYSGSSARRHRINSWDHGFEQIGQPEGFPGRILGPTS